MGRAYQIYIVAAICLESEHYSSQLFPVCCAPFAHLAYGMVLAEDALQVTIGKKDGSRAVPAHQRCFFPEVRTVAGNHDLAGNVALSAFTGQTIDPAVTGAQAALFQY